VPSRQKTCKERGDDTARSEALLGIFCECLRLHQTYYDMRLLTQQRHFPPPALFGMEGPKAWLIAVVLAKAHFFCADELRQTLSAH
jgi:hypothetical protein